GRRAPALAPHSADVEEDRVADPEEPPRIPVSEEALLERQHRAVLAGLITQRIAAQAVVAAEQDLPLGIEASGNGRREARQKQMVAEIALVVARAQRHERVAIEPALAACRRRRVEQE